ncbi:MAG: hypothetical protein RLW62_17245 [Gammaproteobacteria bacterium]
MLMPTRLFAGCRGAARIVMLLALAPALAAQGLDEHEVPVLETLLAHGLDADQAMLVIDATTTGDPAAIAEHLEMARTLVSELGAPVAALDDWITRNAAVVTIDHPLDLPVSYHVLDADERAALFAMPEPQVGWSQFFARFPGAPGLLRLSRVGMGADRRHALVYVEHQCGVECGAGRLVYLSLADDGSWQVNGAVLVWMVD